MLFLLSPSLHAITLRVPFGIEFGDIGGMDRSLPFPAGQLLGRAACLRMPNPVRELC